MNREELAKEVSEFILNKEDGLEVDDESDIDLEEAAPKISNFVEELQNANDDEPES